MRLNLPTLIVLSSLLSLGCDQKNAEIKEREETAEEAIDNRKDEVDAAAKKATEEAEQNAAIEKANIEAKRETIQAQLDADKKEAEAEAAAAKAKADAENE